MRIHLTDKVIRGLNEPGDYRDDEVKGLLVSVSVHKRTGEISRKYALNARIKSGKVCTVTYCPTHLATVENARNWAREQLRVMKGIASDSAVNPNEKEREKREAERQAREKLKQEAEIAAYSLRKALDDYLTLRASTGQKKRRGELSPRTADLYRQCITKHLAEWLDAPLNSITKEMVSVRYSEVCNSSEAAAGNTFRALRAVINYVILTKDGAVVGTNPVSILSALNLWKDVKTRKDNVISDTQLGAWWRAVDELNHCDHSDFFKLLLLTGFRKGELSTMKWKDVNFDDRYWTARNTKNGADHCLPFSREVERILKARYQNNRFGEYLFPGRGSKGYLHHVELSQAKITETTGIKFTPHTLRRTFNGHAIRFFPPYICKRFMNHLDKSDVTQTHYINIELDTLRPQLQIVEDSILRTARPVEKATRRAISS